jgi:hypothetical protein
MPSLTITPAGPKTRGYVGHGVAIVRTDLRPWPFDPAEPMPRKASLRIRLKLLLRRLEAFARRRYCTRCGEPLKFCICNDEGDL